MLKHKIYQLSPRGYGMPSWISYFCCIFLFFFLYHLVEALSSESVRFFVSHPSSHSAMGKESEFHEQNSTVLLTVAGDHGRCIVWGGKLLRNQSVVLQKVLVPTTITINLIEHPSVDMKYEMGGLWHSSDSWSFWEWRPHQAVHAAAEVWRQKFWGTGSLLSKSCVLRSGSLLQGQWRAAQPFDYTNHK